MSIFLLFAFCAVGAEVSRGKIMQNEKMVPGCETILYNRPGQTEDYAFAALAVGSQDWVVVLHGHGSNGDQLFTREDMKTIWLPAFHKMNLNILAPNLRDNAWMNPQATEDLHYLLELMRERYGAKRFFLVGGSMGGTGVLIYTIRHPEDVSAVWAGCPATDLSSYLRWLEDASGIHEQIKNTIESKYTIAGQDRAALLREYSTLENSDKLTMPVFIQHGVEDKTIPIEQFRQLAVKVKGRANIRMEEILGGDHEAPIRQVAQLEWLQQQLRAGE